MTFLITCSGSKKMPVEPSPSSLQSLSFHEQLGESRQHLIEISGIELDWERTLPAWKLYSGNRAQLYPRVTTENWQKPCTNVLILSALFGWIRHTDCIPKYDLKMDSSIGGTRPYMFWRNTHLLGRIINPDDIDLLSGPYRKSINHLGESIATVPEQVFVGYGASKGHWLNEQLDTLNC